MLYQAVGSGRKPLASSLLPDTFTSSGTGRAEFRRFSSSCSLLQLRQGAGVLRTTRRAPALSVVRLAADSCAELSHLVQ